MCRVSCSSTAAGWPARRTPARSVSTAAVACPGRRRADTPTHRHAAVVAARPGFPRCRVVAVDVDHARVIRCVSVTRPTPAGGGSDHGHVGCAIWDADGPCAPAPPVGRVGALSATVSGHCSGSVRVAGGSRSRPGKRYGRPGAASRRLAENKDRQSCGPEGFGGHDGASERAASKSAAVGDRVWKPPGAIWLPS